MKVYAIVYTDYDEYMLYGVYSTQEKAEYWKGVLERSGYRWLDIDTYDLDEPPDLNYNVKAQPFESRQLKVAYDYLKQNLPTYDHTALAATARLMFPEK